MWLKISPFKKNNSGNCQDVSTIIRKSINFFTDFSHLVELPCNPTVQKIGEQVETDKKSKQILVTKENKDQYERERVESVQGQYIGYI